MGKMTFSVLVSGWLGVVTLMPHPLYIVYTLSIFSYWERLFLVSIKKQTEIEEQQKLITSSTLQQRERERKWDIKTELTR